MTIAIVGASGYLGTNFIPYLLEHSDYAIVAISRTANAMPLRQTAGNRVVFIDADIFDEAQMTNALEGVDVAYYFAHMMGQKNKDFYGQEAIAAHRFSAAAIAAKVKRVIFMGGLGNDHEQLSEHLLSRHNSGTIFRENLDLVLEFRASMIIGRGSISYDIIRNLVHKLPFMTLPRWSTSLTQPIALKDALQYMLLGATVPLKHHEIIEIGGGDVVSYGELYKLYANANNRHPFIIRLPFLPEWLGGWWLNLFTPPDHARIGRIMVHSMSNSMVVTHDGARQMFPQVKPVSTAAAIAEAEGHND